MPGGLTLLPELSELVSSLPPCSFFSLSLLPSWPSLAFNGLLQLPRRTAFRCHATPWKEAHAAAAQTEPARLLQWCCGLISTSLVQTTKGNISTVEGWGGLNYLCFFVVVCFFFPAPLTGRIPFHLRAPRSHACLISAHAFSAARWALQSTELSLSFWPR